ncbi:hypothetical protein AVEN_145633-1 [Araneus ventricosus]|uniref:Uncharacterized protein n=1 Tax=Araneus ventricosus TaxID=182803 RepID=A0A4Y2MQF3_ARAVE|nr:hypothetical protein AVEN_145633-1 [Araneus ventricosus]
MTKHFFPNSVVYLRRKCCLPPIKVLPMSSNSPHIILCTNVSVLQQQVEIFLCHRDTLSTDPKIDHPFTRKPRLPAIELGNLTRPSSTPGNDDPE